MKRFLALALAFFTLNVVQANTRKELTSAIKAVTVYPSGATVSRQASVSLQKGENILLFYGVSRFVNPSSLQVDAKGDFLIQSISYRNHFILQPKDVPDVKPLQDTLKAISDRLEFIRVRKEGYNETLAFLQANKAIHGQQQIPYHQEYKNATEYYQAKVQELKQATLLLTRLERKLNARSQAVNAELSQIQGNRGTSSGVVEIKAIATKPTRASFGFSYYVAQASWRVSYDLRFKDLDAPIELAYNALVKQSTGVDWSDARIKLSSTMPNLNNNKPVLNPWYIYLQNTSTRRDKKAVYTESATASYYEVAEDVEEDMLVQAKDMSHYITVMDGVLSTEFEVDIAYAIPSDGQERLISLAKHEVNSDYNHYAAPKIDRSAFLIAYLTKWEDLQLMPGHANIFMGSTYMGQSYLNPDITTDTLEIGFGRDQKVKISRKPVKSLCKTSFLGGKHIMSRSYEITLRNLHSRPLEILLEDQLPISTNEKIEVELDERSRASYDAKKGLLSWRLKLKPQKEEELEFGYTVKYPKGMHVGPL